MMYWEASLIFLMGFIGGFIWREVVEVWRKLK